MKKKTMIIIGSALLALILIVSIMVMGKGKKVSRTIDKEVNVQRRDIVSSIKGTATILPKDQYSITSLVSGDILTADFEEGDIVTKGQLLYKIDSSDVEKNISSADVALRQSQVSYNDALKSKNDLHVKADAAGVVKTMYVKLGDMVSAGSKIAELHDDSSMELSIPFNESDIAGIYVGAAAEVKLSGSSELLYGKVADIKNASYVKTGNMLVQDVKIVVKNPGTLSISDTATATVNGFSCNDFGKFTYITEKTILAKTTGEVIALNVEAGNRVRNGQTIVTLKNETLDSTITNHGLSMENAQITKSKAVDALDSYTITAPISGTVVTKNMKAGDKLDITNTSKPMAVIYDLSLLKFDLNVDELDINRVSLGQEVTITADALDSRSYTGYISNISINATVKNGVTTYPVTVEIRDFDEFLLPGMNVDVEIVVDKAENVLAVPVSSVMRGNLVYVKGEKEKEDDKAPEGFKSITVATGTYSDDYIEIKSGLSEGDIVYWDLKEGSFAEDMKKVMSEGPPHNQ